MTRLCILPLIATMLFAGAVEGLGQGSDPIGLNALRAYDPTLTGSGVAVAQAEAIYTYNGPNAWEVNPGAVGQPASKFEYIGADGSVSTAYPNSLGTASDHAYSVGNAFYGDSNTSDPEGVAPGVSEIYNYEADYFVNDIVANKIAINAEIVNQSFIAITGDNAEQAQIEQMYDNYAAKYGTLFISGAGDGGPVYAPASAYNGIAVAAYGVGAQSSTGPTYDGRSKPDITAPSGATSYSTPLVAGAAAVLLQAAERGDAGAGTETSGSDARVLKALLLNGAVKPADWTHTDTAPLDPNYGAGILNVDNSYMNLRAGEYGISGTTGAAGSIDSGAIESSDEGWDFTTIATARTSGSTYAAESNHYLFDLTAATAPEFTLTSTLVWDRHLNQTDINNLDLYLFDETTGTDVAVSDSTIDNVQELYVQDLAPGEYDLVVTKAGGTSVNSGGTVVSGAETYALAFNFAPVPEPAAGWLVGTGVGVVMLVRLRLGRSKKLKVKG